jgi:hypothetical protein
MLSLALFRRLIFIKPLSGTGNSMPPWIEDAARHRDCRLPFMRQRKIALEPGLA